MKRKRNNAFCYVLCLKSCYSVALVQLFQAQTITIVSRKYALLCNLSLITMRKGGGGCLYVGCDIFSRDYALPRSRDVNLTL